jgi:hypothetical protein
MLLVCPCLSVCNIEISKPCEQLLEIQFEYSDEFEGHHDAVRFNSRQYIPYVRTVIQGRIAKHRTTLTSHPNPLLE